MATDPVTKAYDANRTGEGKTKKEILRCLRRALAREVFHVLTNPQPVIHGKEPRKFRLGIALTLNTAAHLLDCNHNRLSRLERGITKDQNEPLNTRDGRPVMRQILPMCSASFKLDHEKGEG